MFSGTPLTTFPTHSRNDAQSQKELYRLLCEELSPIIIISDPAECNENFLIVLKTIVDFLEEQNHLYHLCSKLAFRVLRLNLFVKNYKLCIGKLLGLFEFVSQPVAGNCDSSQTLEEFILVMILLMLKLLSENESQDSFVKPEKIMRTLRQLGFFMIMAKSISAKAHTREHTRSSYYLIKFDCDIIFQYLYEVGMLAEEQFDFLCSNDLIPSVLQNLLSMGNFDDYTDSVEDSENVKTLVSYEQFKLILLLNEQFMMRLLTTSSHANKVFESLCVGETNTTNGICAFVNILVYHMNREESHVLKILMLKFLYLVFTSSYSARLPYLNDVKIIIDIIVRELNDLNYCSDDDDSSLLALTYVKVLFTMLLFSQLSDLTPVYKPAEITDVLSNIILNCESALNKHSESSSELRAQAIVKTAMKCLKIPCLKCTKPVAKVNHLMYHQNDSADSVGLLSSHNSRVHQLRTNSIDSSNSVESFSLARVSSVRATNVNDYNLSNVNPVTKSLERSLKKEEFDSMSDLETSIDCLTVQDTATKLDSRSILSESSPKKSSSIKTSILEKAKLKKAPPPPPPPPRQRRYV